MDINFLIIGDLTGKRVKSFIDCLKSCNLNNYKIITWLEILKDISVFDKSLRENTIVRLEPPEKDMEIYKELLKLGKNYGNLNEREIDKIDFSNYQIIAPAQWYEGFKIILESIEAIYKRSCHKNIYFMNDFKETLIMMDKRETYKVLEAKVKDYEFSLPEKLEVTKSYSEFNELYGDKILKCFIKLRYGSGGTGILAYKNNPKISEESVFTSLNFENVNGNKIFYSNNKVNCYQDKAKIKELMDWVMQNGSHIERWIPKSMYKEYSFDTRVFVNDKKPEYLISRLSKTPITNLHLRNKRIESNEMISEENLKTISTAATDVMKIFDKSLYAGVDVVCSKDYKPYIIDVNPFGDLFHNLLGTDKNVYYLEIKKAIGMLRGD